MSLKGPTETLERDNLFAQQQQIPAVTDVMTIASGEGKLKRGCLIDANGCACASTTTEGDEEEEVTTYAEVYAVLAEDVDATSAAVDAPVYLTGEFNISAISAAEDETISNYKLSARKVGIFLKSII